MDIVKLASGTEVQTDMVSSIPDPPMLYIRVAGKSLAEVAALFGDSAETQLIQYAGRDLTGYKYDALINEGDAIRVNLKRG